ncbi:hypothetical protein TBLA_0C04800 [Henningerozyma blattae CBS 6284]|uniref:Mitochondrial acidic protein MAM33 n=1 Tax=Henningerozyma blattae (strain ATCC 34711 / CBS 6284 / DSM 70876 / NBRC 10599 / NRRL Y-10934 / UCD 77-7) TaxID=1071380 RepID=I2H1M4_HENB6|nr:hypothetical protein TBLA_0C04800 [Tetrapisispora blattae CBS 6284]CCH60276.1 hypothetical protein TBLA_0C04800 [Tetrapisispora blattae CBS 6284]
MNQSRCFSYSAINFNHTSQKVGQILNSEIKVETELSDEQNNIENDSFNDYLNKFNFKVIESPKKNLAQIERSFDNDNETIKIFFDVAQVANLPYDAQMMENNNPNTESPSAMESNENNSEPLNDDFDSMADNFANVKVVVLKNKLDSAVSFELLMNLDEGSFFIDSVTPFDSIDDALNESAEVELKRELTYQGPPFSNLDSDLQDALEIYLENRGINEELATFIGSYSEFKENNEYISWLKQMEQFFN